MTYLLRGVTQYIDSCIKSMNSAVDYAKTIEDRDRDWKMRWALDTIENECNKGFGALQATYIYLDLIEEGDRNKLNDKLFDSWKKTRNRAFEEIE